jgi:phosphate-selective porin OprO and OprP
MKFSIRSVIGFCTLLCTLLSCGWILSLSIVAQDSASSTNKGTIQTKSVGQWKSISKEEKILELPVVYIESNPTPPEFPTFTRASSPTSPPDPKSIPENASTTNPMVPTDSTANPSISQMLPSEEKTAKSSDMKLKFTPGQEHLLQIESEDGLYSFFVGGRLQIDGTWLSTTDAVQAPRSQGGIGSVRDAVNFRRARFDMGGTFNKTIKFFMQFDFINTTDAERNGDPLAINTPVPTDLWVTFTELPYVGNFRIGNAKPPVSFEHLTSSRFLNFLERSLAFDAFIENQNNGFEPGMFFFNNAFDERMYWAIGVFKNTRSIFGWNVGDGEYDVTGRLTGLPIWENDGEQLLHIGMSASHRDLDDHQERLRTRLLIRNGPAVLHNIVAEARMFGTSRDQIAPELVAVWGPLSLATEYYASWVHDASPIDGNGPNFGTVFFQGGYAEALYFLTGEHRAYDRKSAVFTRVVPKRNFRNFGKKYDDCEGSGWGAWQVGLRYSWVDLDNKGIRGSSAQDLTLGLNWFLNPYMKVQWNYTMLYRNAPDPTHDGYVYGFGTRIAFDF